MLPDEERCEIKRPGKFAILRCCLPRNHEGFCNYVTVGVVPYGGPLRKRSDKEYAKYLERRAKRLAKGVRRDDS